jgi:hypothetical protein
VDDRTDDCAFGAMMSLALRQEFRKLRFQMIADRCTHFRILLFLAAVVACSGQDRGTLMGRVTDPSSAVIAGATITVTNRDTGVKTATTANEVGNNRSAVWRSAITK